ncbi:hypothetical protein QSU92_01690 [Microbacterium sp. ET2]|uniref:hypothetical protein n=1 Tax=Microbacterium albipurpureum TaxID=3050384 RepID=UPI00259D2CE5|nr:hypothetical protein [Microbacterium sp. ET2 (Ac-2212)]WJL95954.1 hypothetical protein QSU92_01690 [Microbacterium sp. ET2 (Ac-2212)]
MFTSASTLGIAPNPLPLLRARSVPHPEREVARGALVRLRRGVYAPAERWRDLAPWDRYLARVHAVNLTHPDTVFSHESAAALLGGPVFGDPQVVHVLVGPADTSRFGGGVRTHRSGSDRDILVTDGFAITSLADTAVDLSRYRHSSLGLAMSDYALRSDAGLSREELLGRNAERISGRGRGAARWALSRATPVAETVLESVSRAVIEWLGFPDPDLQVVFRSGSGVEDRADFHWPTLGVIGEADGDVKYDGRYGNPVEIFRRQGHRDQRLLESIAATAHWGWSDVAAVAPLRATLRSVGLRPIASENTAELVAVRRILFRENATGRRENG